MLIKNNSKITLQTRMKGKMLVIPAGKVTNIDETLISAKQIKEIWGKYVTILTEKVGKNEEVPTETTDNLESSQNKGDLQVTSAGDANKDSENEADGNEGDSKDTSSEDSSNDDGDIEQLVNEVFEEIEGEPQELDKEGTEEKSEEKPVSKTAKKPAAKKKSTKKK